MATSSKVLFNLEKLREQSLESIDFRIAQKQAELAAHADEGAFATLVGEWRVRQEKRVEELKMSLQAGGVDNSELALFRIEEMPTRDLFERRKIERELRELEAIRSQILAKGASLTADVDGNVSLTSTQMQEFFGL